jgi:DNA-binding MarR family transcriptional regulator
VGDPNLTEYPNISSQPNRPSGSRAAPDAVDAVVAHWETLMQGLVGSHASEFTEVGITMAQAKVLFVLTAAGELRMSELAARLQISPSSASELIDRLVELRLVRRTDDPTDRRQVVVTTTPEAHELLERFRDLNQRQLRQLLAHLDASELAVVDQSIEILGRAIARLRAESPAADTHREPGS